MTKKLIFLILSFLLTGHVSDANALNGIYDVVWNTQSQNSSESMPAGGGDVGLNVWVEDGDVLFYVAQSGTFDENNSLLKLGRVRIQLSPNPFAGEDFKQRLDLAQGEVQISGENEGVKAKMNIWVDVFSPAVHVDFNASNPVEYTVSYESWRSEDRPLRKFENFQNSYKWVTPDGLITKADQITLADGAIDFHHHNTGETTFDVVVKQQQMDAVKDQLYNPLENRTFGGRLYGKGLLSAGTEEGIYESTPYKAYVLQSKTPVKKQSVSLVLHTAQTNTLADWQQGLSANISKAERKSAQKETLVWWHDLWSRSYVEIDFDKRNANEEYAQVGRNYQLFRYMLACNAYGEYPTKFNGGLFTYDPHFTNKDRDFTPDFRNWGGGTFTAQNQRLVYFPMLKNGDAEFLTPQLNFYNRIRGNAELRSQHYWGHDGACFVEQIENFGLPNPSEYGWKRRDGYDPGLQQNAWLEHQWDTALEFCYMALEKQRYTGNDISEYLDLITNTLQFFDEHYQQEAMKRGVKALDSNGKLVLYPGSSCETYKMTYNSTSTIAALQVVTDELLQLPAEYLQKIDTAYWAAFRTRIPEIPTRVVDGHTMLAPAQHWERINNTEEPQLYPVYPWGLYGVGKPELDLALNVWKYDPDCQKFRSHVGWKQDAIFAARLGLTAEADSLMRLKLKDADTRFPAFWGPGFDWTPDHNWGGSGMIAVQEMLVQEAEGKIYLFPAWDKSVDVRFKLHLSGNTTIEAELQNGELKEMKISPQERKTEVINCIK
ncbi:MAG: DUF5703 domain-containing protein [Mangrovibacterium sp.]